MKPTLVRRPKAMLRVVQRVGVLVRAWTRGLTPPRTRPVRTAEPILRMPCYFLD